MALVLLALSPVTAPFSTCDLIDLFGGIAPGAGALLKSKAAPDELTPAVAATAPLRAIPQTPERHAAALLASPRLGHTFTLPLRV